MRSVPQNPPDISARYGRIPGYAAEGLLPAGPVTFIRHPDAVHIQVERFWIHSNYCPSAYNRDECWCSIYEGIA